MKTYYFPDFDYMNDFFGSAEPVCVDLVEIERLANEWGYDCVEELLNQMHEASGSEVAEYGVYDG